jgi:DNA mismatch repair protein MutS
VREDALAPQALAGLRVRCPGRVNLVCPYHAPIGVFPMAFHNILFERTDSGIQAETLQAPSFFSDLNLDQIIDAVTADKQEYNLKPFFYTPLHSGETIRYRQEIMHDLENRTSSESINSFAVRMGQMRRVLASIEKLYYKYHKEGWFLEAAEVYCEAVTCLEHDLSRIHLQSRGLLAFREYLTNYVRSDGFTSLVAETAKLKADLSTVKYCVIIKGKLVQVRGYEDETDYSLDVEETFARFKQGAVKDYRVKLAIGSGMSHVEAQILDLVARLYPDVFSCLDDYCAKNGHFLDETIAIFDRQVQFYVAYLEYIEKIERAGLAFCYPQITTTSKQVYNRDGFDLALANKLVTEHSPIVCNDFYLEEKERVFVVSGPNQGGKTTFARTFGQLHYLASLGCPVPGTKAQLFLFDQLFTHFEKEEDIRNLRGKLQDDLVRIHAILDQATPNSIVIMNEIFTSTTLQDAVFLGKEIMARIIQLDVLCVCVTFIDELASLSEKTVSMVSTVVPENPALRTYKIIRKPADGLAYAISVAEKYRLTYDQLKERIKT